jgi:peptidoglycan/xylan/chitin deacetylase (PgdA/CDA1 family)
MGRVEAEPVVFPFLFAFWGIRARPRIGLRRDGVFRNPGRVRLKPRACLKLSEPFPGGIVLSPPWISLGKPVGEVLAELVTERGSVPAIERSGRDLLFSLDLEACVRDWLEEGSAPSPQPVTRFLPFHYHRVPGPLRIRVAKWIQGIARRRETARRISWPVEPSLEALRRIFLQALRLVAPEKLETLSFWPGGKHYAVSLTHDVDSMEGLRRIGRIREIERRFGLPSTWFFPSHHYPLKPDLLHALRADGCEVGCHGFNHDNRLAYMEESEIERRLARAAERLRPFGVEGFRSPSKLGSACLRRMIGRFFTYDSSIPDTDGTAGSRTVFPFRVGGLLEVPLTVPLDADLVFRNCSPARVLTTWREKLRWIRAVGGLAVLTTHPEPHFGGSGSMLEIYERLIREIAGDGEAWIAPAGEIARWWARRERVASS